MPAELADPGVLDRIPHRTRIRRIGDAWLTDASPDPMLTKDNGNEEDVVLPVIGETRQRIRIACEDDSARLALWIARRDTYSVIAVPYQLTDATGSAKPDAGIFARRGAPVKLGERVGNLRAVRVLDELLELHGHVPDNLIANVWLAGAGDPPARFDSKFQPGWSPPPDLRTRVKFLIETKVHTALDPTSPVITTISQPDVTGVIASNLGAYRQIEIARPHARVLGYVSASEVSHTNEALHISGTGGGHGFGMSHADRIDVPAGTCLFDRADGEVVGVQLLPTTRLGRRGRDADHWSRIHVATRWLVAEVYIRDLSDDPAQPRWESCTADAHR